MCRKILQLVNLTGGMIQFEKSFSGPFRNIPLRSKAPKEPFYSLKSVASVRNAVPESGPFHMVLGPVTSWHV
jgi:hypothetical protein